MGPLALALVLALACERGSDVAEPGDPVPATQGDWWLDARPSITLEGGEPLAALNVEDGSATATFASLPHRGFAFAVHDWEAAGYVLHDVLTVAEDGTDLAVTFAYCQEERAVWVYTESLRGALDDEPLDGPCTVDSGEAPVAVDLPALTVLPEPLSTGLRVEGDLISLDDTGGTARLAGAEREIFPFEIVDCTDCPGGPWLEVHALWLAPGDACFAILYLYPERPTVAEVHHGACMPSLVPATATYEVTWSETPGRRSPRRSGPGVPPPGR